MKIFRTFGSTASPRPLERITDFLFQHIGHLHQFPGRIVIEDFYQNTVPGTQAATQLLRNNATTDNAGAFIALYDGCLLALGIHISAAVTAGSAVATLWINGVAATATVTLTAGQLATAEFQLNAVQYNRGDLLTIKLASTGLTATTKHVRVTMELATQGVL